MTNTLEQKPEMATTAQDILGPLPVELRRHLYYTLGHHDKNGDPRYYYRALALAVRDRISEQWRMTRERFAASTSRRVHYLSLEFLLGRSLNNAVLNLDLEQSVRDALQQYGCKLEEVAEAELDAGLGNGGLGRLAACFLDSCANLQLPVAGYGIRYEFGMFHQHIEDGRQVEDPDHWLRDGNPWEIERVESTRRIRFYGRTENYYDDKGKMRPRLVETHDVLAIPFDMPIPGYRNETVNTLRLWKASTTEAFNLREFNAGSYPEAVAAKT